MPGRTNPRRVCKTDTLVEESSEQKKLKNMKEESELNQTREQSEEVIYGNTGTKT